MAFMSTSFSTIHAHTQTQYYCPVASWFNAVFLSSRRQKGQLSGFNVNSTDGMTSSLTIKGVGGRGGLLSQLWEPQ